MVLLGSVGYSFATSAADKVEPANGTNETKVKAIDGKSNGTDVKEANGTTEKRVNGYANGGEREGRTHSPPLIYANGKEDEFELRMRSRSKGTPGPQDE